MNLQEYLLQKLQEECCEVAQQASKTNLFGLTDVYDSVIKNPNKYNNIERLVEELNDLIAVVEMLQEERILPTAVFNCNLMNAKKEKVRKYMEHSKNLGSLTI